MAPTILIVDDDDDVRIVTRLSLERIAGWNVLCASNGPDAIELTATHQPDAVLLDMMMPGMDGLTTAALLRAAPRTRQVPVILFTAKLQAEPRPEWESLGILGVVAKPFDPIGLADEVRSILGWAVDRPVSRVG